MKVFVKENGKWCSGRTLTDPTRSEIAVVITLPTGEEVEDVKAFEDVYFDCSDPRGKDSTFWVTPTTH